MQGFNNFDIFFIVALLCSTLLGFYRGFLKESLVLLTWILSIYISYLLSPHASLLLGSFATEFTRRIIVGFFIGILVLIIGNVISLIITTLLLPMSGSIINRLFGGFFGFARGSLVVVLVSVFSQDLARRYDSYNASVIANFSNVIYAKLIDLNYIPSKKELEKSLYSNLKYIEDI